MASILFVGNTFDSQTARWIHQLEDLPWDLHVFDPAHHLLHPWLANVTVHAGWWKPHDAERLALRCRWPFRRGRHWMARYLPFAWNRIVPDGAAFLSGLIDRLQPSCLHSLGMQPYSYCVAEARRKRNGQRFPPWVYSCKGSDIFHYQTAQHVPRIREVLKACDDLVVNCRRDEDLARKYGFEGRCWGRFQGGGGYPLAEMAASRSAEAPAERGVVAVKGLEHSAGRALTALAGVELAKSHLRNYRVVVYQAHPNVAEEALALARRTGLAVEVLPRVDPDQIWSLFGEARIALAVAVSDGIPNAMIEAMIMGAFPIQTDPGGATSEWIEDGVNGLLIPPDSPPRIAAALERAIDDDELVNRAALQNQRLAAQRVEREEVRRRVIANYREIVEPGGSQTVEPGGSQTVEP